jgi:hypothetical protein
MNCSGSENDILINCHVLKRSALKVASVGSTSEFRDTCLDLEIKTLIIGLKTRSFVPFFSYFKQILKENFKVGLLHHFQLSSIIFDAV